MFQNVPGSGLPDAAVHEGTGLHRRPSQATGGDGKAAAGLLRSQHRQGGRCETVWFRYLQQQQRVVRFPFLVAHVSTVVSLIRLLAAYNVPTSGTALVVAAATASLETLVLPRRTLDFLPNDKMIQGLATRLFPCNFGFLFVATMGCMSVDSVRVQLQQQTQQQHNTDPLPCWRLWLLCHRRVLRRDLSESRTCRVRT